MSLTFRQERRPECKCSSGVPVNYAEWGIAQQCRVRLACIVLALRSSIWLVRDAIISAKCQNTQDPFCVAW